ncbi:hypothetical protein F3F96_04660 [Mariprofundus sp. NF]|uniref:hypothetical protein n=1 Tax=Mariprofundus sp. NF TaxID=2608716 RepID=UPI0015A35551|nr:hypothetical protein [Mariprofundus sp. NF]NWF38419.1 hypothetical protein [Mariprofundus sp. NF]
MAEQKQPGESIRDIGFPMLIAITALLLVLISGIVNYRQNNLATIESGLRDTRDQLQLAKNDIADMKVRTLQQLVEAELTIRNRDRLLDEKDELSDKLSDANARIKELEEQVRELDRSLESKKKLLAKAVKKPKTTAKKKTTAKASTKPKPKATSKAATIEKANTAVKTVADKKPLVADKNPVIEKVKAAEDAPITDKIPAAEKQLAIEKAPVVAEHQQIEKAVAAEKPQSASTAKPSEALADLDIFTLNIATSLQQSIGEQLGKSGFRAKFPEKRQSMKMTKETTVFYYAKSYKPVAEQLVKDLTDITKGKVILRKGASPFSMNKIIAHIIAE